MQVSCLNRLHYFPDKKTLSYLWKKDKRLIIYPLLKAVFVSFVSYFMLFFLDGIIGGRNILVIPSLFAILMLNVFLILITHKSENLDFFLRLSFFRELSGKRIELVNEPSSWRKSQAIMDWQMHNGGPAINAYRLLEKRLTLLSSLLIAICYILVSSEIHHAFCLLLLVVFSLLLSFVFYKAEKKVSITLEKGIESLMENNRKGDYYFALLSSEFEKMKSIRSNNKNSFVEEKYSSFMNPMMRIFKKEEYEKTLIGLLEAISAISLVIVFLALSSASYSLTLCLSLMSLVLFFTSLFRGRSEVEINNERMRAYLEFLDLEKRKGKIEKGEKGIRLENVSYRYPGAENMAVDDVTFSFERGKIYSIVGPNGSGKSTLVKLMLSILSPLEGRIIAEEGLSFSYCPQSVTIFSFTLGENVAMKKEYDSNKVRSLLASLDIYEDTGLKLGSDYESVGRELSGGQSQRVQIARSVFPSGSVLIMDEPTSRLDVKAEKRVYEEALSAKPGDTAVFISHRLSSSFYSDEIIVMDKGKITASGSHEDLYSSCTLYREMFDEQKNQSGL